MVALAAGAKRYFNSSNLGERQQARVRENLGQIKTKE